MALVATLLACITLGAASGAASEAAAPHPVRKLNPDSDDTTDYSSIVEDLWTQTDEDGSETLSEPEFEAAWSKLGLDATMLTNHSQMIYNFFNSMDDDADGEVTIQNMADAILDNPSYQDDMIAGLSNGAGKMPTNVDEMAEVTAAIANSEAKVVTSLIVAGAPSSIYAGQRQAIIEFFATIWRDALCHGHDDHDDHEGHDHDRRLGGHYYYGDHDDGECHPEDAISVTFLEVDRRRKLMEKTDPKTAALMASRRKLSDDDHDGHDHGGEHETEIVAIGFFASAEAAAEAADETPTDTAVFESNEAFTGLEVTDVSTTSTEAVELPFTIIIGVGAGLVVVTILLALNASCWAKKKAEGAKGGCCQQGCCSFNAVHAWSFGQFLAALAMLGTMFNLYNNVGELKDVVTGIVDTVIDFTDSTTAFVQDFAGDIPDAVTDQLEARRAQIENFQLYVIAPGVATAVLLLLSAFLASPLCKGANKGSYCWSKCAMFFATILLIVCLVFYTIFAAVAVIIHSGVGKEQIGQILGLCETVPPTLQQLVQDNEAMLDKLMDAGQNSDKMLEYSQTLEDVGGLLDLIDDGCGYLSSFLDEMIDLFLPGFLCTVAIIFALVVNITFYCSAGCCKAPGAQPKTNVGGNYKGGDKLQNV